MINLKDILYALTDHRIPFSECEVRFNRAISSAVIDSRQVMPDGLFIALPGEHVHGHDYILSAFENGATLAITDKTPPQGLARLDLRSQSAIHQSEFSSQELTFPLCIWVDDSLLALQSIAADWRTRHLLPTVGITGSVGKTSTKELTAALLSAKYSVLKNPGNRNNEIGLPLTLLELEPHHTCAVLEMGFYVIGEINTLCEIAQPQVGVITNIGTVHAERAGSQEAIAQGKSELVQALPMAPEGVAILNNDDPWVRKMATVTRAQVLTYGITDKSDLMARDITTHGLNGVSCSITYKGSEHTLRSPLLGAFSVYNILSAVAVALILGLDWEAIITGLANAHSDLRLHAFTLPGDITILDDTYNASPVSTNAALELLQGLDGRRIAILGDMLELGPYEQSGHQTVGEVAARAADMMILVGPRAKIIAESAIGRGFPAENVFWFPESTLAAEKISGFIEHGDTILIKGSNSMRMDRILHALKEKL